MTKQVVIGKKRLVVETLASRIQSGSLSHGERLIGEHGLAEEFKVSRGTIRQALNELQQRHLITTHTGIGSFVTFDGYALDREQGWARTLADTGATVHTEVQEIVAVARVEIPGLPDAAVLDEGMAVMRIRRIASRAKSAAHGTIISLEFATLPIVGAIAKLPETGLVNGSISATLAAEGLLGTKGIQEASVHNLTERQASIVEREPGASCLRTVRTSFTADGRFVEHVVSLLDPERFTLQLSFGGY